VISSVNQAKSIADLAEKLWATAGRRIFNLRAKSVSKLESENGMMAVVQTTSVMAI